MLVTTTADRNLDEVQTILQPTPVGAVTNSATGIAVLVGTATWGPINDIQLTGNKNEWASIFGTYQTDGTHETSLYDQADGFYDGGASTRIKGGGQSLYNIRVAGSSAAKAARPVVDFAAGNVGTIDALYEGDAGNGIKPVITAGDQLLAALAAPILTVTTVGGAMVTLSVDVGITEVNDRGETLLSTISTASVVGPSGAISVPLPTPSPSGIGFYVYAAAHSSPLHRISGNPVTGAAYNLTAIPSGGNPTIPSANTAISTFNLVINPFDNRVAEVYRNLTPATAAAAINGVSSLITWTTGASNRIPIDMSAYLVGGDSGLNALDADYLGVAGDDPTGLELAKTVDGINFLGACKMSPAIKAAFGAAAIALNASIPFGPDSASTASTDFEAEADLYDSWSIIPIFDYQKKYNRVTNQNQAVLPIGSIIGAKCNGPYWASLTQCKLLGYLGPWRKMSPTRANELAGHHMIPIGPGSKLLKGSNSAHNQYINQVEDLQIPVKLARDLDATCQPLLGDPQVVNRLTGDSDFFTNLRIALGTVIQQTPKEALEIATVDASFDPTLAQANKVSVTVVARQTGKANTIIVNLTAGRTALSVIPQGAVLLTGR